MFEVLGVLVCLLVVFMVLPILAVIKAAQRLFKPAVEEIISIAQGTQEQKWRQVEPLERERVVRVNAGCRMIGRVLAAGGCAVGAVLTFPTPAAFILGIIGYRLLKPIPQEMLDASSYRSTGQQDEPPHSW